MSLSRTVHFHSSLPQCSPGGLSTLCHLTSCLNGFRPEQNPLRALHRVGRHAPSRPCSQMLMYRQAQFCYEELLMFAPSSIMYLTRCACVLEGGRACVRLSGAVMHLCASQCSLLSDHLQQGLYCFEAVLLQSTPSIVSKRCCHR